MFPKLDESPIDGAPVEDVEAARKKVRVNLDELLGGDAYEVLRSRRATAKRRLLRREALEKALAERRRCAQDGSAKA
jgi:hypothetical protein